MIVGVKVSVEVGKTVIEGVGVKTVSGSKVAYNDQ